MQKKPVEFRLQVSADNYISQLEKVNRTLRRRKNFIEINFRIPTLRYLLTASKQLIKRISPLRFFSEETN